METVISNTHIDETQYVFTLQDNIGVDLVIDVYRKTKAYPPKRKPGLDYSVLINFNPSSFQESLVKWIDFLDKEKLHNKDFPKIDIKKLFNYAVMRDNFINEKIKKLEVSRKMIESYIFDLLDFIPSYVEKSLKCEISYPEWASKYIVLNFKIDKGKQDDETLEYTIGEKFEVRLKGNELYSLLPKILLAIDPYEVAKLIKMYSTTDYETTTQINMLWTVFNSIGGQDEAL